MMTSFPFEKIILASKSPRRKDILNQVGIDFVLETADIDETVLLGESPKDLVLRLAKEKAIAAYIKRKKSNKLQKGEVLISADTIVVLDDCILTKPKDQKEARGMLKKLSNRTHQVCTGFCIMKSLEEVIVDIETTNVEFRELDDDLIDWYIKTGEPFDKAGAYGIQGKGALLVKNIEGCYFNVVGLPISKIFSLLF